jgi:hypothetical protein
MPCGGGPAGASLAGCATATPAPTRVKTTANAIHFIFMRPLKGFLKNQEL